MKTHTQYVMDAVDRLQIEKVKYVEFTTKDYRDFMGDDYFSKLFETSSCFQNKFVSGRHSDYSLIFINSIEFALGLYTHVPRDTKIVLALDTTDILAHDQLFQLNPTLANRIKRFGKDVLTSHFYKKAFQRVDIFMPMSRWCAQSLIEDYGIREDQIVVSPGGLSKDVWKPDWRRRSKGVPRLLFVGNDFARKGGDFLLDVYQHRLKDFCTLTIVSNDKKLRDWKALPPDVIVKSGLNQERLGELIAIYQESDVFVFPTYIDKSPNVLYEACATGLPIVARNVGGIAEQVHDGINGVLMGYTSSHLEWGDAILSLLNNPSERMQMGSKGAAMFDTNFSDSSFSLCLSKALDLAMRTTRHR